MPIGLLPPDMTMGSVHGHRRQLGLHGPPEIARRWSGAIRRGQVAAGRGARAAGAAPTLDCALIRHPRGPDARARLTGWDLHQAEWQPPTFETAVLARHRGACRGFPIEPSPDEALRDERHGSAARGRPSIHVRPRWQGTTPRRVSWGSLPREDDAVHDGNALIAVVPPLRKRCGFRRSMPRLPPLRVGLQNRKPRCEILGPDPRPGLVGHAALKVQMEIGFSAAASWRSKPNSLSVSADCFRESQTHQCSLSQIAEN